MRRYKRIEFGATGGSQVVETPEGRQIAVWAKRTGSGSTSVTVEGCFTALPTSNDLNELADVAAGADITEILAPADSVFPYLSVTATGDAPVEVYLTGF